MPSELGDVSQLSVRLGSLTPSLMMRSVLSFLFCALFVLTSYSAGAARGSDRAVGHMVICFGDQTAVVYVGPDGRPVSAPHHCPDCALYAADGLLPGALHHWALPAFSHQATLAQNDLRSAHIARHALARAPPIFI